MTPKPANVSVIPMTAAAPLDGGLNQPSSVIPERPTAPSDWGMRQSSVKIPDLSESEWAELDAAAHNGNRTYVARYDPGDTSKPIILGLATKGLMERGNSDIEYVLSEAGLAALRALAGVPEDLLGQLFWVEQNGCGKWDAEMLCGSAGREIERLRSALAASAPSCPVGEKELETGQHLVGKNLGAISDTEKGAAS